MKTANFFKLTLAAAIVIGIGFLVASDTKAINNAQIRSILDIGEPVAIFKGDDLVWGVLAAPLFGSDDWTIDCNTGVLSGGLGAKDLFANDHNRGTFTITGEPNSVIEIFEGINSNYASTDLTLSNLTVCAGTQLSGAGTMDVNIGADLNVLSTATAGRYTDAYIQLIVLYN